MDTLPPLDITARAGGGGSGGSGSGGGDSIIVLVGYLPMHFLTSFLRRKTYTSNFWIVAQITGWLICATYSFLLFHIGPIGFFIATAAVLGTGSGLYAWFSKLRRSKKVTQELKQAELLDPTWSESAILARSKEVFLQYQADWSTKDWRRMAAYMTPNYYRHAIYMIHALEQAKRTNKVNDPIIIENVITNMYDASDDTKDKITVGIKARANDHLIDTITGEIIYKDTSEFTEYWTFLRQNDTWLLDGIEQATQSRLKTNTVLQSFARSKGFFYSLDWGWLLIPVQGSLFGKAKFGTSDINNHVIGLYKDKYILQLYTYDPVPNYKGSYLVAQTNVPKNYGRIVVRRKNNFALFSTPKGVRKILTEWNDFNKRYEVYASNSEGATSFELLHPVFMERLEALPFEVNIEVVDNVVYLYSPQKTETNATQTYETMLVLQPPMQA